MGCENKYAFPDASACLVPKWYMAKFPEVAGVGPRTLETSSDTKKVFAADKAVMLLYASRA